MSEDESIVFFICYALAGVFWLHWYWSACFAVPRSYFHQARRNLIFAPAISAVILFVILKLFSSFDVRDDPAYLWAYFFMGAAWTVSGVHLFSFFGISARDHVVERKNEAAGLLLSGAIVGLTLCFAGGNIGDGPGWWVVIFAACLSTATLFVFWWCLASLGHALDSIVLDRDTASGLRGAAFLIASGLILGRAVAGNWTSAEATVADFFRLGWPAFALLLVALKNELRLRPTPTSPSRPVISHGILPGTIYLAVALVVILWHGSWK